MLHFNHNIYVPKCQIVRFTEPFSFKKLSGFTPFFRRSGAVRNADRKCKAFSLRSKIWFPRVGNQIWVSTQQNRTIRVNLACRLWISRPRRRGLQPRRACLRYAIFSVFAWYPRKKQVPLDGHFQWHRHPGGAPYSFSEMRPDRQFTRTRRRG